MNNNEVLKSLEEEKAKLENEFTIYDGQLRQLEENMVSVKQEYEVKKESLKANIERVRGAYTVIYNQLKKFGAIVEEVPVEENKPEQTEQVVKPEPKQEKPKTTKKTTNKEQEQKVKSNGGLTPEEIEKINKAVSKPNITDKNGNEIPEYLQTEYNK